MNILCALFLVAIAALHFLSVFTKKYEKALLAVNVSLHILLLLPLLWFGAEIEVLVMLYMLSITLRSILSLIAYKRRDKDDV